MKTKCIHKKINMERRQSGITSLLFILLVGMTLTVATIGYVASMKTMQSSAVTTHAQTQAQMQTMIGYQALSEFLKSSNMDMAKIAATTTGTVTPTTGTVINYKRSPNCPSGTGNYCFDIIGESGGAKAILRALFKVTDTVTTSPATGSIFAGGLYMSSNSTKFQGVGGTAPSIAIGNAGSGSGVIKGFAGNVTNIGVTAYTGSLNLPSAETLRPFANYIFTKNADGNVATCYKNNLKSGGSPITTETLITCPSGVSLSSGVWSFDSSAANLVGIIWFQGNVITNFKETPQDYINTILATGSIETTLPSTGNVQGIYNVYSPYYYLLDNFPSDFTANDLKARLLKVCPADNYPTQYCKDYNATDRNNLSSINYFLDTNPSTNLYLKDINTAPANLANIILMANDGFILDSGNGVNTNFFGNLMGNNVSGGTGSSSGKFNGSGTINIRGNIMVTGNVVTDMSGNMTVTLGNAKGGGNSIPTSVKSVTPASISYP